MTKRSKSYRAAAEKVHADVLYTPFEAMKLAKETTVTKFDSTVEVVFRLGVDPRKADQMVRGTVSLPHGTGKTARVLVFAVGPRAQEAIDAGATRSVATNSSRRLPRATPTSMSPLRPPTSWARLAASAAFSAPVASCRTPRRAP